MFERVERAARAAGITLDYSKLTRSYNTVAAHTLLRHAGPRGTQRALADALFRAYFDGQNVAEASVLAEIATPHGFTAEEVMRLVNDPAERARTISEAESMRASGVSGVPFYVFDGRLAMTGAQPVTQMKAAIEQATAR
jgi:predicted DsbA family dithiol-disulfide isomerase